jgi:2-dehydropantoate 2-reductase
MGDTMRILILGAGALGLSLAARLSHISDVHAVCRGRHADAIASEGLHLTGIWGGGTYRFSCSEGVPADADYDYIFITSKSFGTEEICRQFRELISGREVVSLQNGLGNEEIIARYTDRVIGGTIITGFEWTGTAAVHVSVEAGPVKLGRFPDGLDESILALVRLFRDAGIKAEPSAHIRSDLWAKTLYNSALNPLGAVMEVAYGELARPTSWRIIKEIVTEAFAVAHAEGVELPWKDADAYLLYLQTFQLPATASHHSSMLQDIRRGNRTEIDFINGAIVARAKDAGIPAPVNATISDLIRFKETLVAGGSAR